MASKSLSTLRTRVRRYVGDTSSTTSKQRFSDTVIDDAINDMVEELAADSLLRTDSATDTVVAGDNAYTFPTDAFKIYRMSRNNKYVYGCSMAELDQWKYDWENDNAGEPRFWYPTTVRSWKFYPQAGSSYAGETITYYYFDIPAVMSTDSEAPGIANEFHIAPAYGAAAILLQMDRRDNEAASYQARFGTFKQKALQQLRRMEDRSKDYRMTIDRERFPEGTSTDPLVNTFFKS